MSAYTYIMLAIAAIMMPWAVICSPKVYEWLCESYSTRAGQIFLACDNIAFNIAAVSMWVLLGLQLGDLSPL